jgi:serine/threonine-protein kinase
MAQPPDPNQTADIPPGDDAHDSAASEMPGDPPAGESVLSSHRETLGMTHPVVLRSPRVEGREPVVRPLSDAMPVPQEPHARYQFHGEIARGGMGAVLRGRDAELGRDLAAKVLLEKYAQRPELVRRFVEEAQIGAQLQHPGVVPVYDIGRLGERPFFTMELVRGRTLAAMLAERADSAADRPRFLGIFLQVAQTLAYAHSRGVIHRDLKPANIMVGAYGEVRVMDWGLAKVLPEGGVADEAAAARDRRPAADDTAVRTGRSTGSDAGADTDTQAGALLGTPAYIPPEQATGAVNRLDRRTDVFGLGAILCEILTGEPPYVGRSGEEVRRRAAGSDLAEALARLDACGADAELLALTKACLAAEPADRPKDAQAVAESVTGYLHGVQERLRRAEVGRAAALVQAAEERKRRRVQLALAASVLLTLGLAGGGALWAQRQRAAAAVREAAVEADIAAALRAAETCQGQERYDDAHAALSRAEGLLAGGGAALSDRVAAARIDLDMLSRLDTIRLQEAAVDVEGHFDAKGAARLYAEAFRDYGIPVGNLEAGQAARWLAGRAIREQLVAALDEWARVTADKDEAGRLVALARTVDPNPAGPAARLRQALAEKDRAALVDLARGDALANLGPAHLVALGGKLRALGAAAEAAELLRQAQGQYPGDFWINHSLALTLTRLTPPPAEEAVGFFRAALALRPDSPGVYVNLGVALKAQGDLAGAVVAYRRAIALAPRYAAPHNNLGLALKAQGDVPGAVDAFRAALERDPTNATVCRNLGNALKDRGDLPGAVAAYRKAVALDPDNATGHYNLGNLLRAQDDSAGAAAAFRRAIEVKPDYAQAYCNLGGALLDLGQFADSLAAFRRGHELGSQDPSWKYPSARWVQQAERYVALDAKLPAILRGDARPADAAERLALAKICIHKRMYRAATRFTTEAFAGSPALAAQATDDRYNAACSALLAAAGRGTDAAGLDDAARADLRRQALDWLRAELAAHAKRLTDGNDAARQRVRVTLRQWQQDADLAGVRGDDALAKLPEAERAAWQKLWADAADLSHKAGPP